MIKKLTLIDFWRRYPGSEASLRNWLTAARSANWRKPADLKAYDRSVSFVGNNRAVFNISGNQFRLVVSVAYGFDAMYIKFIGTHAEYDRIDAATVDMDY